MCSGSPYLLSIDNKIISVSHRRSLKWCEVWTRSWFRVSLSPYGLPGEDFWKIFFFLFLSPMDNKCWSEHADSWTTNSWSSGSSKFLIQNKLLHRTQSGTAIFHRPLRSHPFPITKCRMPLTCSIRSWCVWRSPVELPCSLRRPFASLITLRKRIRYHRSYFSAELRLFWGIRPVHS